MKKLSPSFPTILDKASWLSRPRLELLCLLFIVICTLSVFTSRIPTKQALTLDNGKINYNGYVVANKMSGFGKLTFENGDKYEGNFKNGIFNGQGTFTSASGWVYEGQFKNGLAHGQGKLTTETQVVYQGKFEQGMYQNAN